MNHTCFLLNVPISYMTLLIECFILFIKEEYHADSVWEIVTRQNIELIIKMKEDEEVCKAMAELFKPEIDAAFDNGVDTGEANKGIQVFKNMIARGFSKEEAQSLAEINDKLVEQALLQI